MALLSSAMRVAAFQGDAKPIHQWVAGQQLLPWAGQWTREPPPRRHPDQTLTSLDQLHSSGVIDDREYAELRARAEKA